MRSPPVITLLLFGVGGPSSPGLYCFWRRGLHNYQNYGDNVACINIHQKGKDEVSIITKIWGQWHLRFCIFACSVFSVLIKNERSEKRDYIIFSALVKNSKWKSPLLSTCYFSSISWCVRSLSTFGIWDRRRRGGERRGREGGCLEIIWGRALITDVKIAWQQAICPPGSALVANLLLQWTSIRRALTGRVQLITKVVDSTTDCLKRLFKSKSRQF